MGERTDRNAKSVLVVMASVGTLASCSLLVDTSNLVGPPLSASSDAASDGASESGDALPTEPGEGGGALASHTIVEVGAVPDETGTAQQQHLVYANESARWWLFFTNAATPTVMSAVSSPDFVTWTAAPPRTLSLSMNNQGQNFSVAYADLNGLDVIHGIFSHFVGTTEEVHHARSTIVGSTITYESGSVTTSASPFDANANEDGCVTAIGTNGYVYDGSGWYNQKPTTGVDTIGRADYFESTTPDVGASTWTDLLPHVLSEAAGGYVHNRQIMPAGGGVMIGLWPTAETPQDTGNVFSATTSAQTPSLVFSGGTGTAQQDQNDWSACKMGDTAYDAVRRKIDGGANDAFEHVRSDGSTGWVAADAIANEAGKKGSGVVLLSTGTSLVLVTIASDAANSVRYAKWQNSAWSSWQTLIGTSAVRSYLSGSGCGSTHAAVTWTEGTATPYTVVGADITSLF